MTLRSVWICDTCGREEKQPPENPILPNYWIEVRTLTNVKTGDPFNSRLPHASEGTYCGPTCVAARFVGAAIGGARPDTYEMQAALDTIRLARNECKSEGAA